MLLVGLGQQFLPLVWRFQILNDSKEVWIKLITVHFSFHCIKIYSLCCELHLILAFTVVLGVMYIKVVLKWSIWYRTAKITVSVYPKLVHSVSYSDGNNVTNSTVGTTIVKVNLRSNVAFRRLWVCQWRWWERGRGVLSCKHESNRLFLCKEVEKILYPFIKRRCMADLLYYLFRHLSNH